MINFDLFFSCSQHVSKKLWTYFLLGLLWLLPYPIAAQIQTELNPELILIGDTASLKITVTFDSRQEVILPQLGDSLNRYIEISNTKVDTLKIGHNANYIQTITLTGFEPGEFLVNALPIIIDGDTLLSKSMRLEIQDLVVEPNLDRMYPLKPIVQVDISWWEKNRKYLIYWLAGLILTLIIIYLIYAYIKAGRKRKYVSKPLLPPYQEALQNLKKLDREDFIASKKYNEYYTDLSFILRRYFSRRFDFSALALLSDDLAHVMQEKEALTKAEAAELAEFLKDADLVKYARIIPSEEKHTFYRKWIENIINKTRPILEEDVENVDTTLVEKEKLRKLDKK